MEKIKTIAMWFLAVLFIIMGLAFIPGVAGFVAFAVAVLVIPIKKWQDFLGEKIKGKIKAIICVVLSVIMLATVPATETTESDKTKETKETTAVAVATPESTTLENTAEKEEISTTETDMEITTEKPLETETEITTESVAGDNVQSTVTSPATPTVSQTVAPETEPSHTHNYKAATCTAPKTCTSCGATQGSANGHDWKDATCTAPKTCAVCGNTSGSANGHSFSDGKCTKCGVSDPNYVKDTIVWVPASGEGKYHSKASCSNMVNPQQMTKSEAISQGYEACKRCH